MIVGKAIVSPGQVSVFEVPCRYQTPVSNILLNYLEMMPFSSVSFRQPCVSVVISIVQIHAKLLKKAKETFEGDKFSRTMLQYLIQN